MLAMLPGTTIETELANISAVEQIFTPMFIPGGLVLSQVAEITGLAPYTIQNWVKRGFLTPPENKKYSKEQLCRIILINALKDVLQIEAVLELIRYCNAFLSPNDPGYLSDTALYEWFAMSIIVWQQTPDQGYACSAEKAIEHLLHGYRSPFAGAKRRLEKALTIMLTAYQSGLWKHRALQQFKSLDT